MKTYETRLRSISPYSQGKHYDKDGVPMKAKEQAGAYEERTWRNRMHIDSEGYVFIPPMALKNCLSEAAKFLSIQIPGKGKATYTKHFEAGLLVFDPIRLGIKAEDVPGNRLFVPSSGRRGDGKRVTRIFPLIESWEGTAIIRVVDETITEEVLRQHLVEAGQLIGLGVFRPRNNGYFGRFEVLSLKMTEDTDAEAAE